MKHPTTYPENIIADRVWDVIRSLLFDYFGIRGYVVSKPLMAKIRR
jgi:hypothetical protein